MITKIFLTYVLLKYCNGQKLSNLFPSIAETTADLEHELAKTPHVVRSSTTQSNALTVPPLTVTKPPVKLASILGSIELPSYTNHLSNAQVADEFLAAYNNGLKNEDVHLNFEQLVTKYGRDYELHEVITKDGYVLSLYRMLGSKDPVLLMHGLLGSANDFIIAGPESGLAYLLAQQDYDVWLGNARGNKVSRTHISLSPSDAAFWDFSWHEIGVYDLPTMIDYILEITNKTSLKYVGHSQGTTAFFVMASEKPEYNKKVSLMAALSPVAFMSKVHSPMIRLMAPGTSLLQAVSRSAGQNEFLPDGKLTRLLKKLICGSGTLANIICGNWIFLSYGFDFAQLNISNLPVIFSHMPSGASMKQLVHYGQGLINEDFRHFDYGSMENSEKYGTMLAPSYNLDNIKTPIWMFCGESDWLADPVDVETLRSKLKNVIDIYKIPHKEFNHIDFIIAKDVAKLVYRMVLKVLSSF